MNGSRNIKKLYRETAKKTMTRLLFLVLKKKKKRLMALVCVPFNIFFLLLVGCLFGYNDKNF